ncbi:MAG: cell division protein FtsX [Flavobacteriaceae bacterium]|nr:MAG: cell division protein FtsX [Flavobacteriaceae bacterium]
MSNSFEKYQKRRLRSSYFSVVISIALVLFLVGLFGLVILKTNKIANHFREQVAITLFLKDEINKDILKKYQNEVGKEAFVKNITFVSKATAAANYSKDIGEDFIAFLGTNPLKDALEISVKGAFVTPVKMNKITADFKKSPLVSEVIYDKPLIELLTKNIQQVSFWMLLFSGLFTVIAVVLINSSIRLSIYSKRFTIKTMQMVGATKGFIRRPFIWKSIQLGLLGALLAMCGVIGLVFYLDTVIPSFDLLKDTMDLGILGGGIVVLSVLITWLSTFFATRHFLNLRTEELYY